MTNQNGSENNTDKFTMTEVEIMTLRKSDFVEQYKFLDLDKRGNKASPTEVEES